SRIPLPDQRWSALPQDPTSPFIVRVDPAHFPGGPQEGIRWNHVGSFELSGSFYQGFNHLPSFQPSSTGTFLPPVAPPIVIQLQPYYSKIRMVGSDTAIPFHWFQLKAEAAYFDSPDRSANNYGQYVVQLERQSGEWVFIGGYAGEVDR